MLHAVRIQGGRASYSNSYVETSRLQKEVAAGRPLFSKARPQALNPAAISAGPTLQSTRFSVYRHCAIMINNSQPLEHVCGLHILT